MMWGRPGASLGHEIHIFGDPLGPHQVDGVPDNGIGVADSGMHFEWTGVAQKLAHNRIEPVGLVDDDFQERRYLFALCIPL